jgi:hypothetical protein
MLWLLAALTLLVTVFAMHLSNSATRIVAQ